MTSNPRNGLPYRRLAEVARAELATRGRALRLVGISETPTHSSHA